MSYSPNILIVDDIESNRLIFKRILSSLDVNIILSHSGIDALEKLEEQEFAVILLDIKMPEMDGFETLERIRRKPKFEFVPVIFISAVFSDESYQLRGVQSGSVDFLEKPIVPGVLTGKVSTYLKIHHQNRKIMENVNFQKDFLAKMSHEIRNPMNSILGMVDLLSELSLPEDGRKWMQVLHTAGKHLLSIIDDILDLSKIEAGELEIKIEEFDFKSHIENIVLLFQKKANDNCTTMTLEVDPSIPKIVAGDKLRIWQVLSNLINNAVKFTKKGTVKIKVNHKVVAEKEIIHFEVKDSGIGIPQDKLQYVFKRYTQMSSAVTRQFGGTGLGLQISSQLVSLMGGDVWVESKLGEGTSFHITIPFLPRLVKTRKRVLIVDDEADIRTVMELELEAYFDTISAKDGKEALEKVQQERVDMVVTDLAIPIFDGVELLKRMRDKGYEMPVTIISGQHEEFVLEKVKTLPNVKVFSKPVEMNELVDFLNSAKDKLKPTYKMVPLDLLLVDDTEDNHLLMSAYLKETPFKIDSVNNGEEALKKLEEKVFDLVIMDTNMPLMDGNTATKKIRSQNIKGKNGKPLVILALSAYATEAEKHESFEAGHDSYLTKPIKKDTLTNKILQMTSK